MIKDLIQYNIANFMKESFDASFFIKKIYSDYQYVIPNSFEDFLYNYNGLTSQDGKWPYFIHNENKCYMLILDGTSISNLYNSNLIKDFLCIGTDGENLVSTFLCLNGKHKGEVWFLEEEVWPDVTPEENRDVVLEQGQCIAKTYDDFIRGLTIDI